MKYLLVVLTIFCSFPTFVWASEIKEPAIWSVRSVDTMKTSRDLARQKLNDLSYDDTIRRDLELIKGLGANYVAIDTPYDEEFIPYLTRWVELTREVGLRVWFRGNFSNWEGWFDYPKNMNPQEHIRRTAQFIESHSNLFEDGDAFDPCPECENAQWWPQPHMDQEYNRFVINQQVIMQATFAKINKKVHTNWTAIIGGRAKEVLSQAAVTSLDSLVAIDHYTASLDNMTSYIQYFADTFRAKTLLSEFGAPIPDINGKMSDAQQADFIDSLLDIFYENKDMVYGLNYFALSAGTTEIIDAKGNPKPVYYVIKKFYSPATISGVVMNELGQKLSGIHVGTVDGKTITTTDKKGHYSLTVPARGTDFVIQNRAYHAQSFSVSPTYCEAITRNLTLVPTEPSLLYKFRLWIMTKVAMQSQDIGSDQE